MRAPLASRAADAKGLILGFKDKLGNPNEWEEATWMLDKAAELLGNPPLKPHVLVIEHAGWGVDHPDECSEGGADPKVHCPVYQDIHAWLEYQVEPPLEVGRYRVVYFAEQEKTKVMGKEEDFDGGS